MCGCESSHVVKDVSVCERIQILLVSIQLFLLQCVFKRKRKMNSPTNRNNIQQTIKDLVQKSQGQIEFSILNLKTRLSHVNFFIYKELKECLWLIQYLSIVSTFFLFVRKANSNCSFQFQTCYILLMLTYTIKTISFKKYKTILREHV